MKIGAPVGNKNASKAKPWSDAIRKAAIRVIATDEGNRKKLDILAERLLTKALEGDVPALKELGDRIEGKVPLTTDGEGGLTIRGGGRGSESRLHRGRHPRTPQDGTLAARGFNLATDVERLGDLAKKLGGVALIVIDPITAYLGGVDSHKNAEVRGLLAPLAAMAAEHAAAVVCVSHLTKAGGTEAMLRVMGSLGFVAAARAAYLVAKDPDDDRRRLFLPMKNNIVEDTGGLAFRVMGRDLGDGIKTSCVEWGAEPVTMTADEAMAVQGGQEERGALSDAKAFLEKLLVDGPVPSKQIRADANGAGYAWPTILRAQKAAGITAVKEGGHFGGGKQQWKWCLPYPQADQSHTEDHQKTNLDHLQANVSPKPFSGVPFAEDDRDSYSKHLQQLLGGDAPPTTTVSGAAPGWSARV